GQPRGPRFRPGGLPTRGIAVVERPSEEVGRHASSGEWQGQAEAREPRPQERSRGEATAGEQQQRVERAARPGEIGLPREERVRARIREERQEGLSTAWTRRFTSDSFRASKRKASEGRNRWWFAKRCSRPTGATPRASTRASCRFRQAGGSPSSRAWTHVSTPRSSSGSKKETRT